MLIYNVFIDYVAVKFKLIVLINFFSDLLFSHCSFHMCTGKEALVIKLEMQCCCVWRCPKSIKDLEFILLKAPMSVR